MSGVVNTIGRSAFALGFQISPIIMTGGIAPDLLGGLLPIVAITEALNFVEGLLGGGSDLSLDDFFAHYQPLPGSTLIDNQIGMYPFANQAVAANAIIAQPLTISLRMLCPVKQQGGYFAKLATITAMQAVFAQHNSLGGLYTVATPAFIYTNCVMVGFRDISAGESKQTQIEYQIDFIQPLVTEQQAQQALGTLMSKLTSGQPTDGSLSGPSVVTGTTLGSAGPAVIPAASNLPGAAVGGYQPAVPVPVSSSPLPPP